MTTIVTVHGTNAGNESDTGDQWWQQGSDFQNKLSEYVEAPDGRLEFKPFHWGVGPNSELRRRGAGNDLRRALLKLEKEEEPYSVIGHSHGGSVLNHALFSVYAKKLSLPNMKSWVTVGTPFIQTSRNSFYFSRFNTFAQLAFATLAVYLLIMYLYLFVPIGRDESEGLSVVNWPLLLPPVILSTSLFFVVYLFSQRSRKRHTRFHQQNFFHSNGHSWLGLIHPLDEAIRGLNGASGVKVNILTARSFAEITSVVAVYLCMAYIPLNIWLNAGGGSNNIISYILLRILNFFMRIRELFFPNSGFLFHLSDSVAIFLWLSCAFCITWLFVRFVLLPLFQLVAVLGNLVINNRVRSTAFGGDAFGERITGVLTVPTHTNWKASIIIPDLAQEIEDYTEQYAIDAIRKIRALIGSNIASSDNPITDQISDTLSWKELIHTAYFDVDNFIKLVAVSLCEAGLVTPSEKLKNDPEYDKVVGWYREMKPDGAVS